MYQKINLIMSSAIYSTLTHVVRHIRGSATNLAALFLFPCPIAKCRWKGQGDKGVSAGTQIYHSE